MARLVLIFTVIVLLVSCSKQTGSAWVDEWLVRNYDDRFRLTQLLRDSDSYCDFGCMQICTMIPEPQVHESLEEDHLSRFAKLNMRADKSGQLLDLPRPKETVVSSIIVAPLADADIGPTKLACLRKQKAQFNEIEMLLEKLDA